MEWHRFFSDRVQKRRSDCGKITLRRAQQHLVIKKLQKLMRDMESSEAVHIVDFEQMKIENRQLLDLVQEKNAELMKRKLSTAQAIQVRWASVKCSAAFACRNSIP